MKKKAIALVLAVLLCMMTAACSGGNTSSAPADSSSGECAVKSEQSDASVGEGSYVNKTGFPIVNEPITLSVFGSRDQNQGEWKDMLFFQKYQEMTGITLDLQEVPAQGFDEKKNLLFASNELPDIILRSTLTEEQISMYGVASGQLLQLDPYLEEYAPVLYGIMQENEMVKTALTASDGHIYTMPQLDFSDTGKMGFKQWINKEWLEKLGLEIPTTTDELKQVLIAFRDNDPNGNGEADEIPMGIREISSVYVLGGSWGLEHQLEDTVNIEDGQVKYWLTEDRFKEYLEYLSDLYAQGLIWQDYYKSDNRPNWRSNLANAQFGVFYMPYSDVFINVEDQFTGFEPLKGPHGDQMWADATTGTGKGAYAISSTCEYPEAAVRWADYFYSEEGSVFCRYGVEDETFTYSADGIPQINEEILNAEEGFMTALGKINMVPGGGIPQLITNKTDGIVTSDLTKEVSAILVPFLPETVYPQPSLDDMSQERINAIRQDLIKYRDESVTKFIIGEWGFDQWDTYCETLEKIGLSEMQQIYQDAFDALYK